ncbi:MAG TPA: hypothetical protein VHH15_18530, partial [Actinophytocola sp.]|nr:hypothetical protein [Actinophytocola sp.]
IPDDVNAMGAKQRKTWLRQHYDRLRDAPDMTDQALQFRAAYCAEYNDESVCSSLPVSVRGATLGELFAIGSLFFPWARAVRGVGALVGKLVGRGAGSGRATVDAGKFDYLFGKVASNSHNAARSLQNHRQLARIGVHNTPKGRELLRRHFDDIVARKDNIIDTIDNDYGKFQIRESLFVGPRGLLSLSRPGKSPKVACV